jgi:hypothetical protein
MTDEEFVNEIYGAGYRRLVSQLYAVCGDLPTAEDVVQEATPVVDQPSPSGRPTAARPGIDTSPPP